MHHHRTLIAAACLASLFSAHGQSVPCPGEPLIFEVAGQYYGTKTWEHSTDGVSWNTVEVVESEPFILQPEQNGWYRVRFQDESCDIPYVSEPQRFVSHTIELGAALTISIGGVVRNEWGGPVSGAMVRAGCGMGVNTTTDHSGVFLLEGVSAREGLASLTVEKEGYFTGSRTFMPGESAVDALSHAYVTLLRKNLAGTVQGTSGGQVTQEGVSISFPANGFQQNDQPFSGEVSVYLNHIDPSSDQLHDQMPGMLMGVMDEIPQMLLSYGMVGVELTDATGQEVQLAAGSLATISFPVMASQLSTAPATIPLWWFDTDRGYWIQEGEAQRVDNAFVGQVAHFSWWNIDGPNDFVTLDGVVIDSTTGAVVSGARIIAVTETLGNGVTYTNTSGEFSGLVPIGEQLSIDVQMACGTDGAWVTVHSEDVGPYQVPSLIELSVNALEQKFVTGTVVDCELIPIDDGYVLANGIPNFCVDGVFEVYSCAPSISLRGVDMSAGNVSYYETVNLLSDTTDVGELLACTPLFGSVTDIEGNSYPTVIIGSQEWMAANLRTGTYRDGSTIPNVIEDTAWLQLTSGAWCLYPDYTPYLNNPGNGNLYNWYAAANPELCPVGWHVPSDAEWIIVSNYLGGSQVAGGKMKSIYWLFPNIGGTNESGFTALPTGNRNVSGYYTLEISPGFWWSASEYQYNANEAWYRVMSDGNAELFRSWSNKRWGHCVRCVRD